VAESQEKGTKKLIRMQDNTHFSSLRSLPLGSPSELRHLLGSSFAKLIHHFLQAVAHQSWRFPKAVAPFPMKTGSFFGTTMLQRWTTTCSAQFQSFKFCCKISARRIFCCAASTLFCRCLWSKSEETGWSWDGMLMGWSGSTDGG